MRGLPGSCKSTKGRKLSQEYDAVICSADFFFEELGEFDAAKLSQAHNFCKNAFINALGSNKNVIVDNTNTTYSEMEFYIEYAKEKHEIYLVYSDSDWRNDINECYRKTIHNVPLETIKKMAARFESHEVIINKAKTNIKNEADLKMEIK